MKMADNEMRSPHAPVMSGNPLFPGWYADPEIHFFAGRYYIYPTVSQDLADQTYFECWSSADLTGWRNEGVILDFKDVRWSTNFAAWAPSCAEKNGRYYLYFSAGDGAGIGVAVADSPAGPFKDALGIPLVGYYPHGAQPIDAHCFTDDDGHAYLYFGGHGVCVAARLAPTMCAINRNYRDITPSPGYVEGPFMVKRRGLYYLTWSEGSWGDSTYLAAYGIADNPYGPFEYVGKILENHPEVATSAGHHSILQLPGADDEWVICYHRRPLSEQHHNHRVVCLEPLTFNDDGTIAPVTLSFTGVSAHPAKTALISFT
jgi:beta-xylosidase